MRKYLSKVISKVKSKEAHIYWIKKRSLVIIWEELSQSFQERGLSIKDADKKAMQEMEDPLYCWVKQMIIISSINRENGLAPYCFICHSCRH